MGVNRSSPGNHISTGSCGLLWSMIRSDQPEDIGVFDLAGDQALEDLVVDRREELADVGLQDITVTAGECWQRSTAAWVPFPLRQA